VNIKHSALAAAVVTAAVPAGLLASGAGASIARQASKPSVRAAATATVALRSTRLGKILVVGRTGRTLYLFNKDATNKSNCTGQCAAIWPPLFTSGRPSAGPGVSGAKLGEIKRGSSHQVTYAGHPLYTFVNDSAAGKVTGQGDEGFFVVAASGRAIK
jgi:predicted lipoprotein with Yx(FWY)xxD motif